MPFERSDARSTGSCCGLDEFWQADEIVAGHCEGEVETELLDAPQHGPCEPADGLAPAERLLDALSLLLAHRIAGMPRGAGVDGGTPAADVLRDVRRHVELRACRRRTPPRRRPCRRPG